jgi:hypothetical protein
MREKNSAKENNFETLNPQLLRKISQNETSGTLTISGDINVGFIAENQESFQNSIVTAFQNNRSTKILVFDNLSLDAISLLLPALTKMTKLLIRNLDLKRVTHICTTLSQSLSTAPELILDDLVTSKNSNLIVNNFNIQRTDFLNSKRKRVDTGSGDIEPSSKRSRLENTMIVENPNTSGLAIEKVETFERIRQVYLQCAPTFNFEKKIFKGNSPKLNHQREFCEFATKNYSVEYKKFIPMLDKKTGSPVFELRAYALLLAVQNRNQAAVIRLLGGQVRMVLDEPTPENKEAVLAESELLIIKREAKIPKKARVTVAYYLAFKNKDSVYEERLFKYQRLNSDDFKNAQELCRDPIATNHAIKLAREFEASQNFLLHRDLPKDKLEEAISLALGNDHLSILFNLVDHLIRYQHQHLVDYKLSNSLDNCFDNLINYLGILAVKEGYLPVITQLLTEKNINLETIIKNAIRSRKFDILDYVFNSAFLSDKDLQFYFDYSLILENSLEIQQFFLTDLKNHFYSIAAKPQSYSVKVIQNQNCEENVEQNQVLLFVSNNEYKLGFSSQDGYKEQLIIDERNKLFIEHLLATNNKVSNFNTSGSDTRLLRLLLLSLGANSSWLFDPEALAKIMVTFKEEEDVCSFSVRDINLLNLFLQNKGFNLSINDNQLIRSLTQIFMDIDKNFESNQHPFKIQIHKLGIMIVYLINKNPICPLSNFENLDNFVQGIKFAIENGYSDLLQILLSYRLKTSPSLSEIFIKYPKMIEAALEAGMKISDGNILNGVLSKLVFVTFTAQELQRLQALQQVIAVNLNKLTTNQQLLPSDYKDQTELQLQNERQEFYKALAPLGERKELYDVKNLEISKVLLSSSLVFKSKSLQEWVAFFTKIPTSQKFFDLLLAWPNMKPWQELRANPHSFFKKVELENIPDEIFGLIEESYLSIISKP